MRWQTPAPDGIVIDGQLLLGALGGGLAFAVLLVVIAQLSNSSVPDNGAQGLPPAASWSFQDSWAANLTPLAVVAVYVLRTIGWLNADSRRSSGSEGMAGVVSLSCCSESYGRWSGGSCCPEQRPGSGRRASR